jgi:cytochrome c-type biogenesis protein CcmH/NrfG
VKALLLVALVACESSMHEPSSIDTLAPHQANGRSAEQLMRDGDAAWTTRDAKTAVDDYLDAAALDTKRVDALVGAMAAMHFRIEHDQVDKGALSREAVQLGQQCLRRAPNDAGCKYRLAIALGQEAREHPAQGKDAVDHMVDLLHQAITAQPALDDGGPHRVLALVLVRAPAWPAGPGDPEAGLDEARKAVATTPDAAENQLALGEALVANGSMPEAHAAYAKAAQLAASSKSPDATGWQKDATAGLAKTQ